MRLPPQEYLPESQDTQGPFELIIVPVVCIALLCLHAINSRNYLLTVIGVLCVLFGGFWRFVMLSPGLWMRYHDLFYGLDGIIATTMFAFGVTLAIEVWVARLFIPKEEVDRPILWANLYSYVMVALALLLFIVAITSS